MVRRDHRFTTSVLCCALGVVGTFVRSSEAAETFRLAWSRGPGAETCPSAEKLAREVAAKLGRDPFDDASALPEIRGSIERTGNTWTVRIAEFNDDKLVYSDEPTPVVVDDCSEPHALAVHLITVFIQTGRLSLPLKSSRPEPPPPLPTCPSEPLAPIVRPSPAPASSTLPGKLVTQTRNLPTVARFDGHVFLGEGVGMGLLPTLAPVTSLAAGFGKGRFEVDASMFLMPEVKHQDEPFAFGLTAASLGGCARPIQQGRATVLGCGHFVVGALHVVAKEVFDDAGKFNGIRPGDRAWVGLSVAPRSRFVIARPFTLQIGADFIVPLTRYEFALDSGQTNERQVFKQPALTVILLAQVGVTIF